jgi:hypothetical protein
LQQSKVLEKKSIDCESIMTFTNNHHDNDDDKDNPTPHHTSTHPRGINALRVRQEHNLVESFGEALLDRVRTLRRSSETRESFHPSTPTTPASPSTLPFFWSWSPQEQRLLTSLPIAWGHGAAAGLLTLVVLRTGPHSLARFLQKHYYRTRSSNNSQNNTSTTSPFQSSTSTRDPFNLSQESKMSRALWWTVDLALSLLAAATVVSVRTDRDAVYRTLATLPLQPGTSHWCHQLCPVAMTTVQQFQDDPDTARLLSRPHTPSLEHILAATRHCQQRTAYTQRQARQSPPTAPSPTTSPALVAVPPNGLPPGLEFLPLTRDDFGDVYDLTVWTVPEIDQEIDYAVDETTWNVENGSRTRGT